jgi:hypothetical protein
VPPYSLGARQSECCVAVFCEHTRVLCSVTRKVYRKAMLFRERVIFKSIIRYSPGVKALCYKPEGRGFDTRRGKFLNLPNPSGRTRPCGLLSL